MWDLIVLIPDLCLSISFECKCNAATFIANFPVAQWVKRWPTDLADRVRSPPEVKSSQP